MLTLQILLSCNLSLASNAFKFRSLTYYFLSDLTSLPKLFWRHWLLTSDSIFWSDFQLIAVYLQPLTSNLTLLLTSNFWPSTAYLRSLIAYPRPHTYNLWYLTFGHIFEIANLWPLTLNFGPDFNSTSNPSFDSNSNPTSYLPTFTQFTSLPLSCLE